MSLADGEMVDDGGNPLWEGVCLRCGMEVHFSGLWMDKKEGFPPPFVICARDRVPVEVRKMPAS